MGEHLTIKWVFVRRNKPSVKSEDRLLIYEIGWYAIFKAVAFTYPMVFGSQFNCKSSGHQDAASYGSKCIRSIKNHNFDENIHEHVSLFMF